ncbi:bifunctional diaminohydroxyphosphoribosylaminopyrimidine deaminase/5-amino-6-(5-phosphoribosylamino)uracil reductase RibD [Streptomyces sp. E5N91]|uniref:bifunctional diaminohydroxyphosphoribosylaminopyrimidine deaminase/5-amino-6-(5-phosphoribosylamino)uracil reductase RibD n=1 Tax=Streptomyces sp. E5N91 TaxID=1851996 RepID=UPI000EF5CA8B|nr:bifunctional diaminohydroxyphosphoribosylaminopyrimidine deaminase/5-amino-6-(5-phosphoribosylamino)uracil reductase RibD [Streptomyces sp. E5N91]
MRRALELAGAEVGSTGSNPAVGCVLLDAEGTTVATGVHRGPGTPHAEVDALRRAGGRHRGTTAVVTLEPCDHQGRTGPCSRALIEAGVRRVLYAVADPNRVAAGGARRLADAGVEVVGGVLRAEAEAVLEMWLTAVRVGRPFVTWKFAATLDGRSAAADGSARWISSAESRADAHELRARHDAVLVGSGTWRSDDPRLDLRHGVVGHPPLRIALDARGELPPDSRLLDGAAPTLVVTDPATGTADHGESESNDNSGINTNTKSSTSTSTSTSTSSGANGGPDVLRLKTDARGHFPPLDLLAALDGRGVRSVLVEGGPALAASFVRAGLVDRVVAYVAPLLLGSEGVSATGPLGIGSIREAHRFRITSVDRIGTDLRIELRPPARTGGTQ